MLGFVRDVLNVVLTLQFIFPTLFLAGALLAGLHYLNKAEEEQVKPAAAQKVRLRRRPCPSNTVRVSRNSYRLAMNSVCRTS